MVLGYHIIICAYGFWLPNDPRGSWSEVVRRWELLLFGTSTKVTTRRSVAHRSHDRQARLAAKQALSRPPLVFTGPQARAIGRGFGEFVEGRGLLVHACAILPQHLHLVIKRHRYDVEQVVNLLKGRATCTLAREGLHPFEPVNSKRPRAFAQRGWTVYLNTPVESRRAVRYVEENPIREGLPRQRWSFVTPHIV